MQHATGLTCGVTDKVVCSKFLSLCGLFNLDLVSVMMLFKMIQVQVGLFSFLLSLQLFFLCPTATASLALALKRVDSGS